MAQFSLSWDKHKQNICQGLGALQQNGEFVDMTLAADGHHVKVHRMVLSLVSPYIKELLASAECPHPVIFLNKISYTTLCLILEYIYTGEVLVAEENLSDLIEAGKELRIKGLEEMKTCADTMEEATSQNASFEEYVDTINSQPKINVQPTQRLFVDRDSFNVIDESADHLSDDAIVTEYSEMDVTVPSLKSKNRKGNVKFQYSISNKGTLQMILNRYLYTLRYTGIKDKQRTWRCVEYDKPQVKCAAAVITKDEVIVSRTGAHKHPFHDSKILKKVRDKLVYATIYDAETQCKNKIITKNTKNTSSIKLEYVDSASTTI